MSTLNDYNTATKAECISFYSNGNIAIPNSPFGDVLHWQGCIAIMLNSQRGMQIALNGQTGVIKRRYGIPSNTGGVDWKEWKDL